MSIAARIDIFFTVISLENFGFAYPEDRKLEFNTNNHIVKMVFDKLLRKCDKSSLTSSIIRDLSKKTRHSRYGSKREMAWNGATLFLNHNFLSHSTDWRDLRFDLDQKKCSNS